MLPVARAYRDVRINRIFDQVGARAQLPMQTNCFRYHPDLGCL